MASDDVAAELDHLALNEALQGAEYRPLEGSEIRLLRVAPGGWDDQVSCTLHYEPLNEEVEYVALSYTWGDPTNQVGILVNGQPYCVTRSLFTALRRFRQLCTEERSFNNGDFTFCFYPEGSMYIWADALCINQKDNIEKITEIPRMREVYTYCTRVCVWLGEDEDDDDDDDARNGDGGEAAVSLEEIAQWLGSSTFGEDIPRDIFEPKPEYNTKMQQQARDHFGNRTDAFLDKWCKLARRPWFGRVWVIQEVALPEEEPILIAGGCMLGFERFTRPCRVIMNMQLSRLLPTETTQLIAHGALISSRVHTQDHPVETEGEPEDRWDAFGRAFGKALLRQGWHNFGATNPHDHLYSMIGLCGGGALLPPELMPDYAKPFPQVCEDYARCIIQATGSVAILGRSYNYLFLDYDGHMDRPHWVPDFRASQRPVNVWNDVDPSNVSFVGDKFLQVRGFSVGTVVSGYKSLPSQEDTQGPSFRERLKHHHKFLERVARVGEISVEEAVSDWLTTRLLWKSDAKQPEVEELQALYDHFLQQDDDDHDDSGAVGFENSDSEAVKMFVKRAGGILEDEMCALCKNGTVAVMLGIGRDWKHEPCRGDRVVALSGCGVPFYLKPVILRDGEEGHVPLGFCTAYYGSGELTYTASDFSLNKWDESDFEQYLLV